MIRHKIFALFFAVIFLSAQVPVTQAQFGDMLKGLKKSLGMEEGLSQDKIVQGLKQALEIGTANAVETVSQENGYLNNPSIRIPLPESVQNVKKVLKAVGYGPEVEAFELSMNRAAEEAAPQAKALFLDTIKGMSITDASKILKGRDNEATLYFEKKTRSQLFQKFEPIIHTSMSKVGVTRYYQDLNAKLSSIPFADQLNLDLDQYVSNRALDGLFVMLAQEERKIRQDPAARVTDLLKQVFGNQD